MSDTRKASQGHKRSEKILHSDPVVERLIRVSDRKNVATEMITVLGKFLMPTRKYL